MTAPDSLIRICMIFPYAIAKKMNVPPLPLMAAGAVELISNPALYVST
jgi:hypothetical protein